MEKKEREKLISDNYTPMQLLLLLYREKVRLGKSIENKISFIRFN